MHLLNAYSLALAERDSSIRSLFEGKAINLADGKPISWIAKLLYREGSFQQVRGPQLFEDVISRGTSFGLKHFLLGSTPETLQKLESELLERYPDSTFVGRYSPPYRPLTEIEIKKQDSKILQSNADIVWVGLGTPKQDFEAKRIAETMPIVAIAVGAAFDFSAGTLRPAPKWMSKVGLEWVHRLIVEPRRLWKRYLIGNTVFVYSVIRQLVKK